MSIKKKLGETTQFNEYTLIDIPVEAVNA